MKKAVVTWITTFLSVAVFAQADLLTVAFGSCNDQNRPQEMWQVLSAQHPDVWIWGGDNIYADIKNPGARAALYRQQKSNQHYQQLMKTCEITGTWDDHDYGVNDGGKYYHLKSEAKRLAVDFLGFQANHPVWQHEGIYNSQEYGKGEKKVKVINLDTRTFRDTVYRENYIDSTTNRQLYRMVPNVTGDMLGEQQWAWLEAELKNTAAQVVIINSSVQVLPSQHRFEKWANLPRAKARLLKLISDSRKNVIIISGDRHIAEFSKFVLPGGRVLFEFTSSGLTHTWADPWEEANDYRVGPLVIEKNFGIIEIRWQNERPHITLKVMGLGQKVFNEVSFSLP